MAKVIIGIHGLGNKPPKELLEKWWKLSILEGFKHARLQVPKFKFELVYWADLVYDQPESAEIIDENNPYFLDEPYLPSSQKAVEEKDLSFRKKVLQFIDSQIEKVFLNDDFSLNYHAVSDAIMHSYFKELELYYGTATDQTDLKKQTRARLKTMLEKYRFDDILLIGHSMGSIIAYDTLQFEACKIPIQSFFTIGSPLGLPFIRAKIAEEMRQKTTEVVIGTPNCIHTSWTNFSDLEDKVALNFALQKYFVANKKGIRVEDFEVVNDYEINGERNPHKSFGYLRSKEFIYQTNTFLSSRKKINLSLLKNIVQKSIHSVIQQIK
ncbi:MAG: hypothetical protein JW729_10330 [Bacteroidales bacterium]|nr:hypothetical protein [Bacteroidales bacterium]